jgi:hypothetical protein
MLFLGMGLGGAGLVGIGWFTPAGPINPITHPKAQPGGPHQHLFYLFSHVLAGGAPILGPGRREERDDGEVTLPPRLHHHVVELLVVHRQQVVRRLLHRLVHLLGC